MNNASPSRNYIKIVSIFYLHKYSSQDPLTKKQATIVMNKQARKNLGTDFDSQIIEEVWQQAENNNNSQPITVATFAKILSQAIAILNQRIYQLEGPQGISKYQQELLQFTSQKQILQRNYSSKAQSNYQQMDTCDRNIQAFRLKINELNSNKRTFQIQLRQIMTCLQTQQILPPDISLPSLDDSLPLNAPNEQLGWIFKLTVLCLGMELFILTFCYSLLNCLLYSLILYWLFLGYYDQYFVRHLLLGLSISCLFDLIYMVLWMLGKVLTDRKQQLILIIVAMLLLLLTVVFRLILIFKLCAFRDPIKKRQYFVLMGTEIELHVRSGKSSLFAF